MLEKNLKFLKESDYDLYCKLNKTDISLNVEKAPPTLKVDGKTLFSKYNPEREAEQVYNKWKESNYNKSEVVLIGIGNPFLIEKFINEGKKVKIFIPNLEICKIVFSFFDYENILKNIKLLPYTFKIDKNTSSLFATRLEEKYFKDITVRNPERISPKKRSDIVRVLLVKPFYGGSLPVANYCEKNLKNANVKLKTIDSDKCYSAFQLIPETLLKKENISRMRAFLADFVSELTIAAIEEFKPDVLFALAQAPLNERVLRYAFDKGVAKVFWFVEDWRLFSYWKYFAPLYDYFFVIQKDDFFYELKKIGVDNHYYLPLACEPTIHKPLELSDEEKNKYGSTLSFVGAGYYNRRKFFRRFLDYDFKIWGSDWEGETSLLNVIQENGRRVSTEESVKIFNASLININLHSSTYYEGIAPDGDFVNPRTFEIAACKAYQLVDKRKYLKEHFIDTEEILTYSSERELKKYIAEIMNDPEKYKDVKEASYRKVLLEHTYFQRLKSVFKILGFSLEEREKIPLSEKEFYLSEFDSLEEIVNHINKKSNLSDTDIKFLLMKSLKDTYLNQ